MRRKKYGFLMGALACLALIFPGAALAADSASANIPVHIEENGAGVASAKAEIQSEQNTAPMPVNTVVTTDENGDASFAIAYSEVGNYKYTIRQVIPDPAEESVTYDETVYVVNISTVYDSEGRIVPQVSIHKEDSENKVDAVSFSNTRKKEEIKPERIEIPVKKVWEDEADKDKLRPASVTIELLADGKATGETLVLNKENQWARTFTDLEKEKDGKKITYSIREIEVDGYTAEITGDMAEGFTVTNTHTPENPPKENPPTKDTPPTKETPPTTKTGPPVRTGDTANLVLWLALLLASAAALTTAVLYQKKRRSTETNNRNQ